MADGDAELNADTPHLLDELEGMVNVRAVLVTADKDTCRFVVERGDDKITVTGAELLEISREAQEAYENV